MTRRVDETWKAVQEETMVNWADSIIKGHLKSSDLEIKDLSTDLSDGRSLTQLLDNISLSNGTGNRVKVKNKNPRIQAQKRENLTSCFEFMNDENIKLVNIGPSDLIDGNVKLALGLIWTLIRHYQIRSTGKGLSTKQAMLNWVNTLIPERKIMNFTSNWNDGLALCSLVDRIQPGLCPQHGALKPSDGLENCKLGMELAQDNLDIPQIIKPEHLNHPNVDEMSVMTYISYFCKPSIKQLLEWVQLKIPQQHVTNFKTDWNNGINLAALIDAVSPGLFPDWNTLDPHDALGNLTKALKVASQKLEVEPVLKPEAMSDPSVDELNVVTYISRFLNTKAIPLPNNCVASGPGLTKGFVRKEAVFRVDATRAGVGKLAIKIKSPSGSEIESKMTEERTAAYKVTYVPLESGDNRITIEWETVQISGSPFTCNVIDPGSVSFTGREITEGQPGRVGKLVTMLAKGVPDIADLSVTIEHPTGKTEQAVIKRKGRNEADCTYTPSSAGKDKVTVKISQQEIGGSPFSILIVDPSQCRVFLKDPPAGQALLLGKSAVFSIKTSLESAKSILVEAKGLAGITPIPTTSNPNGEGLVANYSPHEIGTHTIIVTCGGDNISGSPLSLIVVDPKKVTFLDAIPRYIQVNKQVSLNVSAKGAGAGQLEVTSSKQGTLTGSIDKMGGELYLLKLKGLQLGPSDVSVTWSGNDIPLSPFTINVCDSNKCSAYGKNLSSGQGKVEEQFDFTVQAKNAGQAELVIEVSSPISSYPANFADNRDGTYSINFTTYEPGPHKIDITWGGEAIPNSPYHVNFMKTDATQFIARGDGLHKCIARQRTDFILIGPEAGLIDKGVVKVTIRGQKLSCSVVPSVPLVSTDPSILVSLEDQGGGNYLVNYAIPFGGDYYISITCSDEQISGSPFDLHALPAPDAGKCRAFGKAIDHPNELVVSQPLEFKVDTTEAGTGSLAAISYDPLMKVVPIFLGEEKGQHNERIHLLKIDPQYLGKHTFEVKWTDQHIPGSPFKFDVGDPSKVIVVSIPDQDTFVGKVGEPFHVIVDASHSGPGKLSANVKFPNGNIDPFKIDTKGGKVTCSYTPHDTSHIELLLSYSGVNILDSLWGIDVIDPKEMMIILPTGHGKVGEYVKFQITGMKKSNAKKTIINAIHENHSATVKSELGKDGVNQVRFTAKMVGKYAVEVICGQRHVSGSPFTVSIADPGACKLIGKLPNVIALGIPVDVALDTTRCGPGKLSASMEKDQCLNCEINEAGKPCKVRLTPKNVGTCQLSLQWADYPVVGTPITVSVVNPSKCTFRCLQLQDKKTVKENEQVDIIVDIAQCGPCTPVVSAGGAKAVYSVSLQDNKNGTYKASFSPWQTGKATVNVLIADQKVPGSPLVFDVLKQINLSQVTVTGDGLTHAIQKQKANITIHGLDVGAMERRQLACEMTYNGDKETDNPTLHIFDKESGKYELTYVAFDVGDYTLSILYEGNNVPGSPFTIKVKPESRADKCIVTGQVIEPGSFLNLKEQAQIIVDSTAAGSGVLTVVGRQPDGRSQRVYINEEESDGHKLHYLIFDAPKVGVCSLAVNWDDVPVPKSPFEVSVVDPSRCCITGDVPDTVQLNQSVTLSIDCTGAGPGSMKVLLDRKEESVAIGTDVVPLGEMDDSKADKYHVNFIGKALGEVIACIEWGGFPIEKNTYTISCCDSRACLLDTVEMFKKSLQVGVPFRFKVKSSNAGKAKLQVKPELSSDAQYTIDIQTVGDLHTVTCTPWTVGEQSLQVLWGEEVMPGSPFKFTVSDPKKCKIIGLPDCSNYMSILGEAISFSVEFSEAGPGVPTFAVCLQDGSEEEQEGKQEGNTIQYSYAPEEPGSLQFVLEYNNIKLLSTPWICEVPDTSQFRATPPKGLGRLNEPVKFLITGVTKQTENFSITAVNPNHSAAITTEHGKDASTFIAYFTPTTIGDYLVQVKHLRRDIEGSPFTLSVANPDGVKIDASPPGFVKVGEGTTLKVDTTEAGPGDLTCQMTPLSGDLEIEPQILSNPDEEGEYEITFVAKSIGTCQLELRWADYIVDPSPYSICFVDPTKVGILCKEFDGSSIINQGDALHFEINGAEAGQGTPEVNVFIPGASDKVVAKTLQDNKDGTFLAIVTPWHSGAYHVTITWSGYTVTKVPIEFEVRKVIDSRGITAHGDGLKQAIAGQRQTVVVNAIEPGLIENGLLVVKCFDPVAEDRETVLGESKSDIEEEKVINKPTIGLSDNGDGTYNLIMCYPYEGQYILNIDYNDQPIYQSPFTVTVKGAPSAERCIVFGPSIDRLRKGLATPLTQQIEIHVDSTGAGDGELRYVATDPTGESVAVFSHQEKTDEKQLHFLRFGPFEVGSYTVKLYWSGVALSDSPLKFSVVDPTRCLVKGLPLPNNGAVTMDDTVSFSIAPKNSGIDTPNVTITTRSDNVEVDRDSVLTQTVTDGVYEYQQNTSEPDNYNINVTLGGVHIPGSPFKCDVVDPAQYAICGLSVGGDYAFIGDTISFQIQGFPPEGEVFSVIAHGPHNDQVCVIHGEEGFYECSFPVIDPGSYEVYVECANKHVRGSPFQVNVADQSKCQVLELPSELQIGMEEDIVVKTAEAGSGELRVLINDEENSSAVVVTVEEPSISTWAINLDPQYVGEVKFDIQWAGRSIPQFPLYLNICDASQCKVFGQALVSKRGKVGENISFTVITHRAGTSKLSIKATGPSAQYNITPEKIAENKFEAQFIPWQVGPHTIDIYWGNATVPKSPFSLHIDKNSSGDGMCHATGDGLRKAVANKPSQFMLFSGEIGLVEKAELKVVVRGALHGDSVGVRVKDENNGSYMVTYVPPSRGAYLATVTFHDQPIPGSPFKINCVAGPDASRCHIDGLHQNTLYIAGKPIEFMVDTTEAGHGLLRVYVQGPRDTHPKVYTADNGKGIYSVKFDALVPGRYFIVVAWSDNHIPGSPFKIRVHPGPDASKVKVSGPGIMNSVLGEDNEICIDTKEAGIGTLLIRVHGIKDAFKIQADPINESEPRILQASYSPTIPGSYDIFIRWSGNHVHGSPFKVNVTRPMGEGEPSDAVKRVPIQQRAPDKGHAPPQKKWFGRKDVSTDEEGSTTEVSTKHKSGFRKKTSSVGAVEREQLGLGKRRVITRSQSGSAIPVGPIKPHMKMRKNPSFGAIGVPGQPQYFYQPGGMVLMSGQPMVQKQIVVEKKFSKRHSRTEEKRVESRRSEATAVRKLRVTGKEETDKAEEKTQKKKKRHFELS